jgi:hypothetical protein
MGMYRHHLHIIINILGTAPHRRHSHPAHIDHHLVIMRPAKEIRAPHPKKEEALLYLPTRRALHPVVVAVVVTQCLHHQGITCHMAKHLLRLDEEDGMEVVVAAVAAAVVVEEEMEVREHQLRPAPTDNRRKRNVCPCLVCCVSRALLLLLFSR